MENSLMREKKLYDASFRGDIRSLDELLGEDELILNYYERPAPFRFNETPLHIAAARGHVDFAKALLQLKPDLVSELDSRLRSPLHLASANGHVEMVKLLLGADSGVCLMEDEFGRTPLHLAAMIKGRVEVVNKLVRARPEAIMYPLNKTKTIMILHLYVIRNGPEALEQLVEVDHTFLNSQDGEGNTILHKVVALKQLETLEYLVSKTQLAVNLNNENSFTAFDMIEQMPRDSQTTKMRELLFNFGALNKDTDQIDATLAPVSVTVTKSTSQENYMKDNKKSKLTSQENYMKDNKDKESNEESKLTSQENYMKDNTENWLENRKDALLIAATVIAGMAYQAGLSPPGGVWDDNKDQSIHGKNVTVYAGTAIMAINLRRDGYILFWALNTASLVAALSTVLLLLHSKPCQKKTGFGKLKQKLLIPFLAATTYVTMTTMTLAYLIAILTIAPGNKGFEAQWEGTYKIIAWSVVAWLGLMFITFLGNAYRIFIKVKERIKRSPRNADKGECQGHSNNTSTTTRVSV